MTLDGSSILFTGGSGLLGRAFGELLPEAAYPSSTDFNVTDFDQMDRYASRGSYHLVVHAAAFTSPPKIDQDPLRALEVNVIGTANVVKLCLKHALKLVYLSTDYVFRGDTGRYREDDAVYPVNKYAWSKLGGECAVRLYDNSLIVRTSFGPDVFPYAKAFEDQWTSRESVSVFARKLLSILDKDVRGTLHVGGPRRTVFEYAKSLDPSREIAAVSIQGVDFAVPKDTSLVCERYQTLVAGREAVNDREDRR